MTTALAITAIVSLTVLLLLRERELGRERRAWERERRQLLDRIQHPQIHQVEPVEIEPMEPPKDTAELAYVGQEVPEFINVGGDE